MEMQHSVNSVCFMMAAVILLVVVSVGRVRAHGGSNWSLEEALHFCEGPEITDLYEIIDKQLRIWKPDGIARLFFRQFTTREANKGIALAFLGGIAYVVEGRVEMGPDEPPVSHHAHSFFTYMQVMLEMQRLFGEHIPDVEFVIATTDRPMVALRHPTPHLPVFRFCGSDVHADIMIPIFHFYSKKYQQKMLDSIENTTSMYPWESRKEVLFGRFAHYHRMVDPEEPSLQRQGTRGANICRRVSANTSSCRVRQHFIAAMARYPDLMDVESSPRVPMGKHAAWKYLLHLDGQALSSRIDLLLPLRSLVFKEESGYKTFYYHLLKPKEHYIPIWNKFPEEALAAVKWARENDDEAKRIAENGQKFALKYLSKKARACYWYRLLVEFSKLLRYKVSPQHEAEEEIAEISRRRNKNKSPPKPGAAKRGQWVTVEEYLNTVASQFEGGKRYQKNMEEW